MCDNIILAVLFSRFLDRDQVFELVSHAAHPWDYEKDVTGIQNMHGLDVNGESKSRTV